MLAVWWCDNMDDVGWLTCHWFAWIYRDFCCFYSISWNFSWFFNVICPFHEHKTEPMCRWHIKIQNHKCAAIFIVTKQVGVIRSWMCQAEAVATAVWTVADCQLSLSLLVLVPSFHYQLCLREIWQLREIFSQEHDVNHGPIYHTISLFSCVYLAQQIRQIMQLLLSLFVYWLVCSQVIAIFQLIDCIQQHLSDWLTAIGRYPTHI